MKYIKELAERKKLLKIRMNNLLTAVDHSFGKEYYHKVKNKNFQEINKIRDEVAEIEKKINFALNLNEEFDKYEKIDESNSDFEGSKKDSLGTR
jgi:hypothetical protein